MPKFKAETSQAASGFYFFSFLNKHFIINKSTVVLYLASSQLYKFVLSKALKKFLELDKDENLFAR